MSEIQDWKIMCPYRYLFKKENTWFCKEPSRLEDPVFISSTRLEDPVGFKRCEIEHCHLKTTKHTNIGDKIPKKEKKKKLIKVKRVNCCGACGFFYEDSLEEDNCLNIDANNDYDMDDISEDTVCPYFNERGYVCEDCDNNAEDTEAMFIVKDNHKHVYCEDCVVNGIKNYAHRMDIENIEVNVEVIVVLSKHI
jgi:hypothetical protein